MFVLGGNCPLAKSWPLECMQKASGDLVAGTEVFRGLGQCHMSGNGSEKAPKHCECECCEVCRASLQVQDYAKALDLSQHTSATDSSPDHSRLLPPKDLIAALYDAVRVGCIGSCAHEWHLTLACARDPCSPSSQAKHPTIAPCKRCHGWLMCDSVHVSLHGQ